MFLSYKKIFRFFIFLFSVSLLYACGGPASELEGNKDPSIIDQPPELHKIDIIPSPVLTRGTSSLSLAKGNSQPFVAIGHHTDGSALDISDSVTWSSSDGSVATISGNGLLTGAAIGTTTLTATKDGVSSNQVSVNVTDAVITTLQVTPATVEIRVGQTQQMQATAIYSDLTTGDVTNVATWSRSAPSIISVTHSGSVNGLQAGWSMVSASYEGISSNAAEVRVLNTVAAPTLTYETTWYTVTGRTEDNASLEYRYDDEDFWRTVDNAKKFNLDLKKLPAPQAMSFCMHELFIMEVYLPLHTTIPGWRLISYFTPKTGMLSGRSFAFVDKDEATHNNYRLLYSILDYLINKCEGVNDSNRETIINGRSVRMLTRQDMEELRRSSDTNGAPSGWIGQCSGWCVGGSSYYLDTKNF